MEYEKPEHPPPTTPMRRPAGTGFCWPMISFTLATAFAVRVTGAFFTSGVVTPGVVTSGTVVVAIHSLLGLETFSIVADVAAIRTASPCIQHLLIGCREASQGSTNQRSTNRDPEPRRAKTIWSAYLCKSCCSRDWLRG